MKGLLLFDIDGVIRDVANSYRQAVQETVKHFSHWLPELKDIDNLKAEGLWNNDWDASLELIKRHQAEKGTPITLPSRTDLIRIFNDFYFGQNPQGDPNLWKGFIKEERLLVDKTFFDEITANQITWGFVSGAETVSAKFLLEERIGLKNPPLVAMEDAPEKPNPLGLINLSKTLLNSDLGPGKAPIAYLGDTVADIETIKRARNQVPGQQFLSIGVAPPHLHGINQKIARQIYEDNLKKAGANGIINSTNNALEYFLRWLDSH